MYKIALVMVVGLMGCQKPHDCFHPTDMRTSRTATGLENEEVHIERISLGVLADGYINIRRNNETLAVIRPIDISTSQFIIHAIEFRELTKQEKEFMK